MHTAPVQLQPAQGLPAVVKQTAASAQLRTTMDSAAMRPSSRYVARAACCGQGGGSAGRQGLLRWTCNPLEVMAREATRAGISSYCGCAAANALYEVVNALLQ